MNSPTLSLLAATTVLILGGCADADHVVGPRVVPPGQAAPQLLAAPLVVHLVAPPATDPLINTFVSDHYVWLDPSARSLHRLLVFMPGTGQKPADFQLIEQEGARLGYHVIGLSFANSGGLAKLCPPTPDPAACFEQTRLEILDGVDRSPLVSIDVPNSIDNRLTKLIQYLVEHYPDEGWEQFQNEGGPKWPLIAVAGLSVGGGEAVMISKLRLVDRVVMFSAVPDSIGHESVPWVGAPGATPGNRYYGLGHDRDPVFPSIGAGWDSLGMAAFGPPVLAESGEAPYGWTHMLVTDLMPVGGLVGQNAHGSTATDKFTPLAADSTPALLEAWRYLLDGRSRHPGNVIAGGPSPNANVVMLPGGEPLVLLTLGGVSH